MALVLLIRHATTEATGTLVYGRAEGHGLDDNGRRQAERLAERLAGVRIAAVYSSPLPRCRETAEPIARTARVEVGIDEDLNETDVGRWTGRSIRQLRRTRAWQLIQRAPSRARFPDGESFPEILGRAVRAVERIAQDHRGRAVAVVSHGDIIRVLLAHYAGTHLDLFQRVIVHPASVSAVLLDGGTPRIVCVNDTGDLGVTLAAPRRPRQGRGRRVRG